MRRVLACFVAALLALGVGGAAAQPAACRFALGFAGLREAIGHSIVGECLEDERHGANGDAVQRTTGGLLVWRRFENLASFTDGHRSWIAGPDGVQTRLNSERFHWEPPDRLNWPREGVPVDQVPARARAEAAKALGVPDEQVGTVRVDPATWDASLGCPQPGLVYAAVAIPGFRVLLEVYGRRVHVHASFGGALICPRGSA